MNEFSLPYIFSGSLRHALLWRRLGTKRTSLLHPTRVGRGGRPGGLHLPGMRGGQPPTSILHLVSVHCTVNFALMFWGVNIAKELAQIEREH